MLTHLELFEWNNAGLYQRVIASVCNHLQTDSPLNLQHLGISDEPQNAVALVPHIRSLKSVIQKRGSHPSTSIFSLLLSEQIFPPVITTECTDRKFVDYIMSHPGITHLSILEDVVALSCPCTTLNSLALHSQTLEYFCTFGKSFCAKLKCPSNELSLLRCTRLRQLVLHYDEVSSCYGSFRFEMVSTMLSIPSFLRSLHQCSRKQHYQPLRALKACQYW
jgi:hypothetical protein